MFTTKVPLLTSSDVCAVSDDTCEIRVEYVGAPYSVATMLEGEVRICPLQHPVLEEEGLLVFKMTNLDRSMRYVCHVVAATILGESKETIGLLHVNGEWKQELH